MYVESKFFTLGHLNVYWYGLFISLGIMSLLTCLYALCRKKGFHSLTVPMYGALGIPIGILCSRFLFCLLDFRFHGIFSLRAIAEFWGGGFSMTGALAGMALAAFLTARFLKADVLTLLDLLFPAAMLFVFFARLGEGFTELLGKSRSLSWEWLKSSFLVWTDGYDAYLNTWLLEALTAACLCLVTLFRILPHSRKKGDTLLTGMLLLGCSQVLWESLRFDSHMRFSFISMQQILFACMFAWPLILFALRCGKKNAIKAIGIIVLVVGGAVGLEFMIDRSGVSNVICYCLYLLLLAVPATAGLYWKKRSDRA